MSDTQKKTMSEDFIVNIGIVLTPPEHTKDRIDISVEEPDRHGVDRWQV